MTQSSVRADLTRCMMDDLFIYIYDRTIMVAFTVRAQTLVPLGDIIQDSAWMAVRRNIDTSTGFFVSNPTMGLWRRSHD